MDEGMSSFAGEAQELRDFIGDRVLVGHNVQLDKRFLNAEIERAGVQTLRRKTHCTMWRFREESGQAKGSRLDDVARAMGLDGRSGQVHDALEDVRIAVTLASAVSGSPFESEGPIQTVPAHDHRPFVTS